MARLQMFNVAIALGLVIFVSGCDHTRRIHQSATLEVSVGPEGDSRLCESVSIREAVPMDEVDKRREAINPGRFESLYPWHGPVKIDDSRQATFSIDEVMIVSTADKTPPLPQHPFSGKSFLVKVEGCDGKYPVFQITFVEGETEREGNLSVRVTDISEAVFLEVDGRE